MNVREFCLQTDKTKRDESVIILPHNTLRFVDAAVQAFINSTMEEPPKFESIEDYLIPLLTRKNKDLAEINRLEKDFYESLVNDHYLEFYEAAPRTDLYNILMILKKQSFISSIKIATMYKDLEEDASIFDKIDVYGETYEDLVKYLSSNEWTMIVLDDIELFHKLSKEESIDWLGKSVLVSKLGYNYEYNEFMEKPFIKYFDEYDSTMFIDLQIFSLFTF